MVLRGTLSVLIIWTAARLSRSSAHEITARVARNQLFNYFWLLTVQFGRIAQIYGHVSVTLPDTSSRTPRTPSPGCCGHSPGRRVTRQRDKRYPRDSIGDDADQLSVIPPR